MALKAVVDDLQEIDEALRPFYKAQGEVHVLAIEGIDLHPSVKGLKDNQDKWKASAAKLKTDLAEATGKLEAFGDTTPEDIETLRATVEKGGGKAPSKEDLDRMVEDRYGISRAKLEKQLEALTAESADLKTKYEQSNAALSQERIFNKIKDAAVASNVREKALPMVTRMAAEVWKLDSETGEPVAYKGDQPIMGPTGPITMDDWIGSLQQEHEYLFKPSKGAGSQGSEGSGSNKGTKVIAANQAGSFLKEIASGEVRVSE